MPLCSTTPLRNARRRSFILTYSICSVTRPWDDRICAHVAVLSFMPAFGLEALRKCPLLRRQLRRFPAVVCQVPFSPHQVMVRSQRLRYLQYSSSGAFLAGAHTTAPSC
eukprot:4116936-Amphidinium_carterae.1